MWPKLLDMSKDECKRLLRRTELEAYAGVISAFRAQGDLTKEKKQFLNELAVTLSISTERHRAEVRRAVNDEKLSTVAERLSGPNNSSEWAIEGRRLIPLMPRLVPQTVFSLTANQAANAAFSHNLTLPLPSETARKEAPSGSENSGGNVKLPSPSSGIVVLPSGLSIPIKDVDLESPPVKRSRRDSSSSLSKEATPSSVAAQALHASPSPPSSMLNASAASSAGGSVITVSRSQSLPASKHHSGYGVAAGKQHGSKSVIGLNLPSGRSNQGGLASSTTTIKAGFSPTQSPLKFTYTKSSVPAGNTTPASSAQKVILVSSTSTSFTPSILQRSQSAPSTKSSTVKPGSKQSVILTGVSGDSPMSRQSELTSGGKQAGMSPSARQHAAASTVRQQAMIPGRQPEGGSGQVMSGRQLASPDALPGMTAGAVSGGRKPAGNVGAMSAAMNSTVITARTTAAVVGSQMTSYVSTNMVGKPRGRAVSKQKLVRQMNVALTSSMGTLPTVGSGITTARMKVVAQPMGAANTKQQRSPSQSHTMETLQRMPTATATMATGKPVTTVTGHKVVISTTSAGVVPHLVTTTTPLIRTKPSSVVTSMGVAAAKMMPGGGGNVGDGPKMAPGGATSVTGPKMVQTIKATTTSIVSQPGTTVTQIISSKPSLVMMQKGFPQGSQAVASEQSKHPQAHSIIASSLLQRPRISMVTGVPSTTTAASMSPTIRFPAPQSTKTVTMTTVKSPGSRRIRSPITMVTAGNLSLQQKRPVGAASQNTLQGSGNTGSSEDVPPGKQVKDYQGSLTRGLLGSCSHPNSEWIDYDGSPPDSSASSAIKALLEFRSHPDARKHSQTIDLSHIGPSSAAKTVSMPSMPAVQCTTVPSRLSHHALMTRVSQHALETTMAGLQQQHEAAVHYSPTFMSNMQSRLKRALTSERPAKPAFSLQTATMEVEKALQEQNKALLAKQEESAKTTGTASSQDEAARSLASLLEFTVHKTVQPEKIGSESQHVTIEDQGVVTERVNLSSEDVSSFVDQFEQFLERESLENVLKGRVSGGRSGGQGRNRSDQMASHLSSESKHTGQPVESFQLLSRNTPDLPKMTSAGLIAGSVESDESRNQNTIADLALASWRTNSGMTSSQKGAASVVLESDSVDISQMKLEDFTSQRLQDEDNDDEDKQNNTTSPESSPIKITGGSPTVAVSAGGVSGSEESQGIRISNRKRKAPAPIDEEPGPTSMSSWARAAFNLLQRVMRFRGANRSKGDLNAASWFTRPVATAEAPGYNRVIKTPMDFGTVKRKLESGQYDDFAGFHSDMMLVHDNCVQYNPPGHEIRRDCEEVFQFYTTEYNKVIERWDRPSPKKPKPDDHHGDKSKHAAARSLPLK